MIQMMLSAFRLSVNPSVPNQIPKVVKIHRVPSLIAQIMCLRRQQHILQPETRSTIENKKAITRALRIYKVTRMLTIQTTSQKSKSTRTHNLTMNHFLAMDWKLATT